VKKIEKALWIVKNKTIGILGLAFKPNTDDMRFAPSIDIIGELQREGAKIKAYDPEAAEKSKGVLNNIEYCSNPYEAAKDADALVILTEWDEFRALDMKKIKSAMKHPLIIDGRNIYNPEEIRKEGFTYMSIGRVD
jgi:UDPglucose 6-dehydrogenase